MANLHSLKLTDALNLIKEAQKEYDNLYGLMRVTKHGHSTKQYEEKLNIIIGRVTNIISFCPEINLADFEYDAFNRVDRFSSDIDILIAKYSKD